jgi:hypothetical protein
LQFPDKQIGKYLKEVYGILKSVKGDRFTHSAALIKFQKKDGMAMFTESP